MLDDDEMKEIYSIGKFQQASLYSLHASDHLFIPLMCMVSYVVIATTKLGFASCLYIPEGLFTHRVIGPDIVVMDCAIDPLTNTLFQEKQSQLINVNFL